MKLIKENKSVSNVTSPETMKAVKAHLRVNAGKWGDISEIVAEIKDMFPHAIKETEIVECIEAVKRNSFYRSEVKDLVKSDLQKIAADIPEYKAEMTKTQLLEIIKPINDDVVKEAIELKGV